jgi:hypothetical protein
MQSEKNKKNTLRPIDSMADVSFDTFMVYYELSQEMDPETLAKFQQMRFEFHQIQMKMTAFLTEFAKKFD